MTFTGDPEAHVFVPVKETFTAQRRNALTFEFAAGKVIVIVNRETASEPLLLIWKVRTVPFPIIVVYAIPVLVKL